MRYLLAAAALLAFTAVAEAQAFGPTNPSTATWLAPITNSDGSVLNDLSGYNAWVVGPLPAAATVCPVYSSTVYAVKKTLLSATTTPVANTTVVLGTAGSKNLAGDLGLTVDGQYCLAMTAVDLTMNEGAASPPAPFVRNKLAPGAPSGLQLVP